MQPELFISVSFWPGAPRRGCRKNWYSNEGVVMMESMIHLLNFKCRHCFGDKLFNEQFLAIMDSSVRLFFLVKCNFNCKGQLESIEWILSCKVRLRETNFAAVRKYLIRQVCQKFNFLRSVDLKKKLWYELSVKRVNFFWMQFHIQKVDMNLGWR